MKPNKVNPFIDTRNTDKVIRLAKNAVDNRDWLVIVGEIGAGKSFLRKQLCDFYNTYPGKFISIDMGKVFEGSHLSIGNVMKAMLQRIAPDEKIPGNTHGKYELLRTSLAKSNKRIILFFDEAQNITQANMRDIKMIYETDHGDKEHLFAIIMFGKNNTRWENILNGNEIGWRVHKSYLHHLDKTEILSFACKSHDLKFESGKAGDRAKEMFLSNTHPTPLGVKHMVDTLYASIPNFNGTITEDNMKDALGTSLKNIMSRYKISQKRIQQRLEEEGHKVDKSTISRVFNYDTDGLKPETSQVILDAALKEIEEAAGSKMPINLKHAANS